MLLLIYFISRSIRFCKPLQNLRCTPKIGLVIKFLLCVLELKKFRGFPYLVWNAQFSKIYVKFLYTHCKADCILLSIFLLWQILSFGVIYILASLVIFLFVLVWIIYFQAFDNNEEMKLKARRESSEVIQAPVVDKVCADNIFI